MPRARVEGPSSEVKTRPEPEQVFLSMKQVVMLGVQGQGLRRTAQKLSAIWGDQVDAARYALDRAIKEMSDLGGVLCDASGELPRGGPVFFEQAGEHQYRVRSGGHEAYTNDLQMLTACFHPRTWDSEGEDRHLKYSKEHSALLKQFMEGKSFRFMIKMG